MQGLSSDFPINPLLPSGGTWMTMYQRKVKNCRLLKAMMKSSPQLKIMMIWVTRPTYSWPGFLPGS